jgi:Cu2+-exporting ATPase
VAQIVGASRAVQSGLLVKSPTAFERLSQIDTVIVDKIGTRTTRFRLDPPEDLSERSLAIAAGMAARSRHPYAEAIRRALPQAPPMDDVAEHPGEGLVWTAPEGEWRLGSSSFAGVATAEGASGAWLSGPGQPPVLLTFSADLRPEAETAIASLRRAGYSLSILSGDRSGAVGEVATWLAIDDWAGLVDPASKAARMETMRAAGRRVLLVGDGINDAPAMAATHASIAPAEATDVSLRQADVVWLGTSLRAVPRALTLARACERIIRQNIALSFVYNAVWVPLAIAGAVTPWVAALAMSASSILVTLNALRLKLVSHPFLVGFGWGLIPCGMVYAAIFTAALTGSGPSGALLMAGFALGTMPAVTMAALGLTSARQIMRGPASRLAVGCALVLVGPLSLALSLPGGPLCVTR